VESDLRLYLACMPVQREHPTISLALPRSSTPPGLTCLPFKKSVPRMSSLTLTRRAASTLTVVA
jgi:hypothetical protein